MKKMIALLLGLMMICSCAAAAVEGGELPALETEKMEGYLGGASMLTEASFDKIYITPFGESQLYGKGDKETWYVAFDAPEGFRCASFSLDDMFFVNLENDRQYEYAVLDRASYENFLLDCKDESYILRDGSDGVAAFINPDGARARVMIGLDDIQKGAKLLIYISSWNEVKKLSDEEKPDLLKQMAQDEIARLQGNIECVKTNKFWTEDKFGSLKLYTVNADSEYLTVGLPEVTFNVTEEGVSGKLFPVIVDKSSFTLYAVSEPGKVVTVKGELGSYAYAAQQEEDKVSKVTLSDGSEWIVYVANEDDGKPYSVYAAKVTGTSKNDDPIYLSLQLSRSFGSDVIWPDLDAFVKDLEAVALNIKTE